MNGRGIGKVYLKGKDGRIGMGMDGLWGRGQKGVY
jgi:hypothetical protein